jgi:hypothetical protein
MYRKWTVIECSQGARVTYGSAKEASARLSGSAPGRLGLFLKRMASIPVRMSFAVASRGSLFGRLRRITALDVAAIIWRHFSV